MIGYEVSASSSGLGRSTSMASEAQSNPINFLSFGRGKTLIRVTSGNGFHRKRTWPNPHSLQLAQSRLGLSHRSLVRRDCAFDAFRDAGWWFPTRIDLLYPADRRLCLDLRRDEPSLLGRRRVRPGAGTSARPVRRPIDGSIVQAIQCSFEVGRQVFFAGPTARPLPAIRVTGGNARLIGIVLWRNRPSRMAGEQITSQLQQHQSDPLDAEPHVEQRSRETSLRHGHPLCPTRIIGPARAPGINLRSILAEATFTPPCL